MTSAEVVPDEEPGVAPLLDVRDLSVEFPAPSGAVRAVREVSFRLPPGGSLALLGESGSGKTAVARALMGILDEGARVGGTARFDDVDLVSANESVMRRIRGRQIAMVFQDALSALNPVFSVGWQIAEMFRVHQRVSRRRARALAVDALERVGIPDARRRYDSHPHEFSGGMRQRALIATALALNPRLLIADEPTTALDVTIQAQVLDLIRSVHEEYGMGLVFISHDLDVVAEVVDRVAVMYAGEVVEMGAVDDVYDRPAHPYTRGLMASLPSPDVKVERLVPIEGTPPTPRDLPSGCPFHPRCPRAEDVCRHDPPVPVHVGEAHFGRCHFAERIGRDG